MPTKSKAGACSSNTQTAKANCLKHNRREGTIPSYVNTNRTHTNRTVFEDELISDRKSILPLIKRAEIEYTNKTGQKCQKSFSPFRESVLHVKAGITDEQLLKFKENAEKLLGWNCVGIWLHQDEGHVNSKYIEGNEDFAINYHAHVLWDCQDHKTGKAIRCDRKKLSEMQDILAEATGMERGNKASETGRIHRDASTQREMAQEQRIEILQNQVQNLQSGIESLKSEIKDLKEVDVKDAIKLKVLGKELPIIASLREELAQEKEKHAADIEKAEQARKRLVADANSHIKKLREDLTRKDNTISKLQNVVDCAEFDKNQAFIEGRREGHLDSRKDIVDLNDDVSDLIDLLAPFNEQQRNELLEHFKTPRKERGAWMDEIDMKVRDIREAREAKKRTAEPRQIEAPLPSEKKNQEQQQEHQRRSFRR